jgi:hypothetical protein
MKALLDESVLAFFILTILSILLIPFLAEQ